MKILLVNNCHYRRGGADVVYLNTGELLEKYGHEIFYFSQKNDQNIDCKTTDYFIEPIDFFNQSIIQKILSFPRFFYSNQSYRKLDKLLTDLKPEIAHIHTYKGTLTPSVLRILKKRSVPTVISLHDYGLLCPHNSFIDGQDNICTKCYNTNNPLHCIFNRCNRNNLILSSVSFLEFIFHKSFFPFKNYFSHLIGVSNFIYTLHHQKSEFKNKVSQLYNFSPGLYSIEPQNKIGKYFLYYGRLSNEKGILTLMKSWLNQDEDVILKIVGDGSLKKKIIDFINENKLKNIEYLGFKDKKSLYSIISKASFIIVPSEWYENNPLTIIEAYTYGKPVIGSKIGGIHEIIQNTETGFLFEMGNIKHLSGVIKTASVITDTEYQKLSFNARKFAESHFSEESHYNALMDIYKRLL